MSGVIASTGDGLSSLRFASKSASHSARFRVASRVASRRSLVPKARFTRVLL